MKDSLDQSTICQRDITKRRFTYPFFYYYFISWVTMTIQLRARYFAIVDNPIIYLAPFVAQEDAIAELVRLSVEIIVEIIIV